MPRHPAVDPGAAQVGRVRPLLFLELAARDEHRRSVDDVEQLGFRFMNSRVGDG